MVNKPRIYQLLRRAGVIHTEKDAIALLNSGQVKVNDKPIHNPNFQVNPKKEQITINDIPLPTQVKKVYFILNKPAGYLTSKNPSGDKKSIMDLIDCPKELKNTLFPVGRLDYNSSGLIIITNDGDFAHQILQPKNRIEKEYLVTLDRPLAVADRVKLENGVIITVSNKPYKTKPATISLNPLTITIIEGKKRQVRLMFKALGYTVTELQRIRIGNLKLNIKGAEYKEIEKEEALQALS